MYLKQIYHISTSKSCCVLFEEVPFNVYSFFFYNWNNFNVRTDLSVNNNDIESLSIEILFEKKCNTLNKPPSGLIVPFEFLKRCF